MRRNVVIHRTTWLSTVLPMIARGRHDDGEQRTDRVTKSGALRTRHKYKPAAASSGWAGLQMFRTRANGSMEVVIDPGPDNADLLVETK